MAQVDQIATETAAAIVGQLLGKSVSGEEARQAVAVNAGRVTME